MKQPVLFPVTLIAFVLLFFLYSKSKSSEMPLMVTILFTCLLVLLLYSMSLGRGEEYRWNGNILYSN